MSTKVLRHMRGTYDLLHDLAGRVKVNKTLVDLQLIAVPGLGTLTTRLSKNKLFKDIRIL